MKEVLLLQLLNFERKKFEQFGLCQAAKAGIPLLLPTSISIQLIMKTHSLSISALPQLASCSIVVNVVGRPNTLQLRSFFHCCAKSSSRFESSCRDKVGGGPTRGPVTVTGRSQPEAQCGPGRPGPAARPGGDGPKPRSSAAQKTPRHVRDSDTVEGPAPRPGD